jgi:hypothetical protein
MFLFELQSYVDYIQFVVFFLPAIFPKTSRKHGQLVVGSLGSRHSHSQLTLISIGRPRVAPAALMQPDHVLVWDLAMGNVRGSAEKNVGETAEDLTGSSGRKKLKFPVPRWITRG